MNVIVLFACMYMCLVESYCCSRPMPTAMQAIFFITAFVEMPLSKTNTTNEIYKFR